MNPLESRVGFSLVELVMVLVLMGLMSAIAIPLIRPEKFRLDSAVVEVGSTLSSQERNSILRQHNVVLAMDTAQRRLRVHYDEDNSGSIDAGEQWQVVELGDGVAFGRGGAPAMITPASQAELEFKALQSVEDRLAAIKLEPRYGTLDSLFTGVQDSLPGLTGFTRTTLVTRHQIAQTGGKVLDYTEVVVTVSGPGLIKNCYRKLVLGAP